MRAYLIDLVNSTMYDKDIKRSKYIFTALLTDEIVQVAKSRIMSEAVQQGRISGTGNFRIEISCAVFYQYLINMQREPNRRKNRLTLQLEVLIRSLDVGSCLTFEKLINSCFF